MRWFPGVLLLLAAACSPPAELPAKPPELPISGIDKSVPSPPALPPAQWRAELGATGGVTGYGRRWPAIGSESNPDCRFPVVESAVAAAHPENWQTSYKLPKWSGLTDQFHYQLVLTVDGKVHRVGFDDENVRMLPDDLRRVFEALRRRCP